MSDDSSFCPACGRPLKPAVAMPAAKPSPPQVQTTTQSVPAPWSGAIMLQSGEAVKASWPADNEVSQLGVVNGREQLVKVRVRGFLVLTNQRMAFIQERGIFGKSYHLEFAILLEQLEGLSMGGLVMKYVSLSDSNGERVMHVHGVGNEVEFSGFRSLVQDQVSERQEAIEAAKRRDRVQIVLDFGFLRDYMSRGGLSLQVVKCPQCGAPISLPAEGSQVVCTHCGSTIFAQDIMEKVRELIG